MRARLRNQAKQGAQAAVRGSGGAGAVNATALKSEYEKRVALKSEYEKRVKWMVRREKSIVRCAEKLKQWKRWEGVHTRLSEKQWK